MLAACQKKGDVATSDTTAAPAMTNRTDTTASGGAVATPKNDWTDAQILAFAATANAGEVQEGQLAEHKATNPAVKNFAKLMVTDHTKMLADTRALEKKLAITPDSSKDDVKDLAKSGQDDMKDLYEQEGRQGLGRGLHRQAGRRPPEGARQAQRCRRSQRSRPT